MTQYGDMEHLTGWSMSCRQNDQRVKYDVVRVDMTDALSNQVRAFARVKDDALRGAGEGRQS